MGGPETAQGSLDDGSQQLSADPSGRSAPAPFLKRNAGLQRRATASISSRYVPKGGFLLEVPEHKPKVSKLKQLRAERRLQVCA